jgi:hypothetical protein
MHIQRPQTVRPPPTTGKNTRQLLALDLLGATSPLVSTSLTRLAAALAPLPPLERWRINRVDSRDWDSPLQFQQKERAGQRRTAE